MSHRGRVAILAAGVLIVASQSGGPGFWHVDAINLVTLAILVVTASWPVAHWAYRKWEKRTPFSIKVSPAVLVSKTKIPLTIRLKRPMHVAQFVALYYDSYGNPVGGNIINLHIQTPPWHDSYARSFPKRYCQPLVMNVDAREPIVGTLRVFALPGLSDDRSRYCEAPFTVLPQSTLSTEENQP